MDNIVATHKRVAQLYFEDGSIKDACPPLKALLHIMRDDQFEGKDLTSPEIRALFTREALMNSDWYKLRLATKQEKERRLWRRNVDYLSKFLNKPGHVDEAKRLGIEERLELAVKRLQHVKSPEYLAQLNGTLGADPSV
jgi:phosphoenolpyruvate carboxykinase (diphosphate)